MACLGHERVGSGAVEQLKEEDKFGSISRFFCFFVVYCVLVCYTTYLERWLTGITL
jgi:hypothetical protein